MKKTIEEKKNEPVYFRCPRCESMESGYPAVSRRDNKTEICSDCGTEEAMFDFSRESIPKIVQKELNFMQKLINANK
jgi:transcription elongation factor Elf1